MPKLWPDLETRFGSLFRAPFLTPTRVRIAYAIGVATDVLQFILGPLGWAGTDEVLDVVAYVLQTNGFHPGDKAMQSGSALATMKFVRKKPHVRVDRAARRAHPRGLPVER